VADRGLRDKRTDKMIYQEKRILFFSSSSSIQALI